MANGILGQPNLPSFPIIVLTSGEFRMLDTISSHWESVRALPSDIWPGHVNNFQPNVNLPILEGLVKKGAQTSKKSSKKRNASFSDPERHTKRVKSGSGTPIPSTTTTGGQDIAQYPNLQNRRRSFALDPIADGEEAEDVAVLRHVLDIHYNNLRTDGPQHEANFARLICELQSTITETTTWHLANLNLYDYRSRLVAEVKKGYDSDSWLLLVPTVEQDADDHDSTASDLVEACMILQDAGKIELDIKLSLVLNPEGTDMVDQDDVHFCLNVELVVSLRLPHIFLPVFRKEIKKNATVVDNAQRRVLGYIYGRDRDGHPTVDVNISYFYSTLHAAKHLPSPAADQAMQSALLKPTLLPFQRRSVGRLLEREGMEVLRDGSIAPKLDQFMYSFWEAINEGNHTWYYNRLSGVLTRTFPEPPAPALGGILAEEPGLGKTLEMISLILLNPAPESRNPSVTTWDPEARLNVKAIKSSLIVTPVSLASQWIDEIRAHAPSLKILVYDGWSKVKVPITRTQLEEEQTKSRSTTPATDPKGKGKSKAKPASKAKKTKAKGQAKAVADEGDDMTKDEEGNLLEWCEYVHQFDVVITTYQVLRSDFNVARAAPVRPRREDVVYLNIDRPRSPLVMVEWNRVVMDEVQMVGGGNVEDMVSLIPRLSSFAVSGTPAKAQISDMIYVLKFLRIDSSIGSAKLWNRLLKPGFAHEFSAFFQSYAVRTTKASVKDELTIPQQTRFLVPIELGRVEQHVYDQSLETILLELGLDARGVAASEGWEIDTNLLRASIRRLRGICTHPQVGQLQGKGEIYKPGALKTMDAVLENMREQSWRNVMEFWKTKINAMIRQAQLIQQAEGVEDRLELSRDLLNAAEAETNKHINEITAVLAEHHAKGEILKKEAAARRRELGEKQREQLAPTDKGKGKAVDPEDDDILPDDEDESDEEDVEDKGLPKTPAGKEHRVKTQAYKSRLREGKLALHRVMFMQGDVYHALGGAFAKEEDAAYAAAEVIRRDLLKVTEDDATRAMSVLQDEGTNKRPSQEELEIPEPFLQKGGIRTALLMEEANEIVERVLNPQTGLLWEWRGRIMELLTEKLNPGDEADGQEYQRNLDNQGEAEVYLQAYAALLADRREALVNERTLLAAHDVREKRLRHTKAAIKASKALDFLQQAGVGDGLQLPADFEVQPENQVQYKELSDQRKEFLSLLNGRALKSVLVELNGVQARMAQKNDPEKKLTSDAVTAIRKMMSYQGQLHDKLDADLTFMRKAFNDRILYFRQLQEISDSVSEVEWEEASLEDALEGCALDRAENDAKINTNRARYRYLANLADNNGGTSADDEDNVCILCRCDFIRGFITQCAHIFCEGCMKAWLARREGKTCPVCRVPVNPDTVQRFATSIVDEAPKQPINGETAPQSRRQITYNKISPELFIQIESMESYGDFGSKIQTLVRHLLYLQSSDPGSKSIVFSAWADSLHIVEWALNNNGIRSLRIDQKSKGESAAKKFKTNPEILVLLLHGERENAGLNITCASRVFLLESVVHHSFEIQAIARIDRMGQTRPTEVYCYYAEDTVERNILDLAARKGLSLYTKDNSAGTIDVSSFSQEVEKTVVDAPAKKREKGDFIFKIDDMLAVLFPHMYEEIEFLLPIEDTTSGDLEMGDLGGAANAPVVEASVFYNAEAGPSRSRRR